MYEAGTYTQTRQENLPELNRKQKDGTLQRITCLQLISSYNTYMGGVDKNDQMKSYYTIPVSGKNWWSRILFDLVNRSIFNNFVLEQESPNHAERTLKSFRIDLAKQLIGDFSSQRKSGRPSDEPRDPLARLRSAPVDSQPFMSLGIVVLFSFCTSPSFFLSLFYQRTAITTEPSLGY